MGVCLVLSWSERMQEKGEGRLLIVNGTNGKAELSHHYAL